MAESQVVVDDKQVQRAIDLRTKRLYHAALDAWDNLLQGSDGDPEFKAQLLDRLGQLHFHLGHSETALRYFQQGVAMSTNPLAICRYREHEAIAHSRLYDYDRALRIMSQTLEQCTRLGPSKDLARLLINLSFVQGLNAFYSDSITSAEKSLNVSTHIGITPYYPEIYNNIGLAYLEQHIYDSAEMHLLQAIEQQGSSVMLSSLMELSRLYLLKGDLDKTVTFGTQAVDFVWSSIVSYAKDEIARLCQLLARASFVMGETHIALRLLEKAQLMFGQLGMWREWDQAQSQMDDWIEGSTRVQSNTRVSPVRIERFITLLDVMNAQELMHDQFASLLDARVLYANSLADAFQLEPQDRQTFIYACRFADYGLTALEPDVALAPQRSNAAWEQYQQHPHLSVRMLESLQLDSDITTVIADHHEHYDGSGYPRGKQGNDIPFLARLFAVVDRYSLGVTMEAKAHRTVLESIVSDSGTTLDPGIVQTFCSMFQ